MIPRHRAHWALLRAETDRVGREVESWPYDRLDRAAEEQPPLRSVVAGVPVSFQVDCYRTLDNGDLAVCVDAVGGPSTVLGIKPSYRFYKRRDGSVYHGR